MQTLTAAIDFNDSIWWLVSRSSGIVAWALVTFAVCWGLMVSTKAAAKATMPATLFSFHRFLGGMAVTFSTIHVLALVADPHVYFGWLEILVPWQSQWRPQQVAWGVIAFYLLLAVELTSLLMRRLPRQLWRQVHRGSFILYALSTYHGVVAGPDDDNPWLQLTMLASISIVAFLTVLLILTHLRSASTPARRRAPVVDANST